MAEYDGSIRFSTKLDTSGFEKELNKLSKDSLKGFSSVFDSVSKAAGGFEAPVKKAVDASIEKLNELKAAASGSGIEGALQTIGAAFEGFSSMILTSASGALPQYQAGLTNLGQGFNTASSFINACATTIGIYNSVSSLSTSITNTAQAAMLMHSAGVSNLNIAMGILNGSITAETTLTAAKTVAEGTATVGTQAHTAAQVALNAAMKANTIGLVVAGLSALVMGIGAAISATDKETEAEKRNRETLEKNIEATEKLKEASRQLAETRESNVTGINSEFAYAQKLGNELKTIVDENGRIEEKYRARAQVILNELNPLLGTEYDIVDGTLQKSGELLENLDLVLEKQQAQSLIDSIAPEGIDAIKNQATAYENLMNAKKDLNRESGNALRLESQYASAAAANTVLTGTYNEWLLNQQTTVKSAGDALEDFNDTIEGQSQALYDSARAYLENEKKISDYQAMQEACYREDYDLVEEIVQNYGKVSDEEVKALAKTHTASQEELQGSCSGYTNALHELLVATERFNIDSSQENLDIIKGCSDKVKEEYDKIIQSGGEAGNGYISELNGTPIDLSLFVDTVDNALKVAEDRAEENGLQLPAEYASGMDSNTGEIIMSTSQMTDVATSELANGKEDATTEGEGYGSNFASGISSALPKVVSAAKNLASTASINLKSWMPFPTIEKFSRGTRGAPEGPAVVNDGTGPELIESRKGGFRMVPSSGPALTWLNRGDRVYTAEQTRAMLGKVPHYAKGIGNSGYSGTVSITTYVEEVPEAFDKALDELELRRDLDVIDEAEYYAELEKLRDEYFAKGSDKWWEYEKEIYEYRKEKAEEAAEEAAEAELDAIEKQHDKGLMTEAEYIEALTAYRDKYYEEGTEEFIEMTEEINDISRQNELDMLEFTRDAGLISTRDYYKKLQEYRDKYLAVGSKEWLEYTKEIYQYHVDGIKASYDEIAGVAEEQLADIKAQQEALSQKLADSASFYRTVTIKNAYEDGSDMEFIELKDWTADIEKLKRYNDAIDAAKERILSGGIEAEYAKKFIDKLMEESVEDGTELAELLAGASDEEFKKYLDGFVEYQKLSEGTAAHQYEAEIEDTKEQFIESFTEAIEEAGLTVPDGFFDIGADSADAFIEGFSSKIEDLYEQIEQGVSLNLADGLIAAAAGGATTYSTFSPVYNFYGGSETTAERIHAAQAASERDKLSGGY